jgi:hypothetical protein
MAGRRVQDTRPKALIHPSCQTIFLMVVTRRAMAPKVGPQRNPHLRPLRIISFKAILRPSFYCQQKMGSFVF